MGEERAKGNFIITIIKIFIKCTGLFSMKIVIKINFYHNQKKYRKRVKTFEMKKITQLLKIINLPFKDLFAT